jgi:hypothetical protein
VVEKPVVIVKKPHYGYGYRRHHCD